MLSLDLFADINAKSSSWEKNETDGTLEIRLIKDENARWPLLFTNQEDDDKPGKELLWVDKHLQYEEKLDAWLEEQAELSG